MGHETPRVGRQGRRVQAVTDRVVRYQLIVIAPSGADVVQFAGGWLFDRRMAGWDVDVLVPDQDAARALQILGVRIVDLHAGLASVVRGPERAAALAVGADLVAVDERIHQEVLEAVRSGLTEVALWGDSRPSKIGGRVDSTQYRLSAAARAYKGHALAAAGLTDLEVGHTERLYRSGYRPVDSDLMPVGRSVGAEG
ncbi:MAG: hypothetical protein QOE04_4970 [Mycobacterium sp.]|jgi:hypothetical protein|nr:hypothetical protein [Mycobacterium sp.]